MEMKYGLSQLAVPCLRHSLIGMQVYLVDITSYYSLPYLP